MEDSGYHDFLVYWHTGSMIGTGIFVVVSVLILVFYHIKLVAKSHPKSKYDWISEYEIALYFWSILSLAFATGLAVNLYGLDTVELSLMWFFIRLFMSICAATLVGYIGSLILKYSYAGVVARKLKALRYQPRINPATGNVMRLLTEDEEDVHLDEGMQAEENAFSVDYDVWLDEETGESQIEKYPGHLQAHKCDRCGFQTLKQEREEIIKPATQTEDGELIKHYKCTYCGRVKRSPRKIVRLSQSGDNFRPDLSLLSNTSDKALETVEIRITSAEGHTKSFDFQSTTQAMHFLETYQKDKEARERVEDE